MIAIDSRFRIWKIIYLFMSDIKAIDDLINGYANSKDSSFLIPNLTEDFLTFRPSNNPISAIK